MYKDQGKALLSVESPFLSSKSFRGIRFYGKERLSTPFHFTLSGILKSEKLDFNELIESSISITLTWANQSVVFHGDIGSIEEETMPLKEHFSHVYTMNLYPRFWFLQHTKNCYIFRKKSIVEILKEVLKKNKVLFEDRTKNSGRRVKEFCVQYNESDFSFVSRLMEEAGIFYFFRHTHAGHWLILADDTSVIKSIHMKSVQMEQQFLKEHFPEKMLSFQKVQKAVISSVSTKDFFFETPDKKLYVTSGDLGDKKKNIYYYPGNFAHAPSSSSHLQEEGEKNAKKNLYALRAEKILMKGKSTVLDFSPGKKFSLKDYAPEEGSQNYSLLEVEHFWDAEYEKKGKECSIYYNEILSFPSDINYKPLEVTQKPLILGTQTAIVTGPKDKEIWSDEYGRVKIKFHWDISAEYGEESSSWVRVSTVWAGQGWGFFCTPRIGQEVLINYLEGDPDHPIIVGCVWNGHNKPPYELPQHVTKSTFKTRTSPSKEKGFNELRFEDKKDQEEVYIHAQKDMLLEVEETCRTDIVKGSEVTVIRRGDRSTTLSGENKPVSGKGDDILVLKTGSQMIILEGKGKGKGDQKTTISRGDSTLHIKRGNHSIELGHGSEEIKINNGHLKITVSGGGINIETKGFGDISLNAAGALNLKARSGINISSVMGVDVSAKTGINIQGGPFVNIKGALVKLN